MPRLFSNAAVLPVNISSMPSSAILGYEWLMVRFPQGEATRGFQQVNEPTRAVDRLRYFPWRSPIAIEQGPCPTRMTKGLRWSRKPATS